MIQNNNVKHATEPTLELQKEKKRRRKGAFPRISFKKTLELASTVYELGQGEPVRRLKVFDYLKKSPESGPSRMLVTTSGMYGLTSGSYVAEYLSATEKGRALLTATSEREQLSIILDILLENEIFSKFVEYWMDKSIPSDDIAADWLLRNCGLTIHDARTCWNIIKENLTDYKLIQVYSGKSVVVKKEIALDSVEEEAGGLYRPIQTIAKEFKNVEEEDNKRNIVNAPKPFGSQVVERDFKYGRARLILPAEMTRSELKKINSLIESLITEVDE